MKYHLELQETKDMVIWAVVENYTDLVIHLSLVKANAYDYMEFLEKGGAFAGLTPRYIVEDLNEIRR